jgi:hypothetical protein
MSSRSAESRKTIRDMAVAVNTMTVPDAQNDYIECDFIGRDV